MIRIGTPSRSGCRGGDQVEVAVRSPDGQVVPLGTPSMTFGLAPADLFFGSRIRSIAKTPKKQDNRYNKKKKKKKGKMKNIYKKFISFLYFFVHFVSFLVCDYPLHHQIYPFIISSIPFTISSCCSFI